MKSYENLSALVEWVENPVWEALRQDLQKQLDSIRQELILAARDQPLDRLRQLSGQEEGMVVVLAAIEKMYEKGRGHLREQRDARRQ